jgi:hypothetical protein
VEHELRNPHAHFDVSLAAFSAELSQFHQGFLTFADPRVSFKESAEQEMQRIGDSLEAPWGGLVVPRSILPMKSAETPLRSASWNWLSPFVLRGTRIVRPTHV